MGGLFRFVCLGVCLTASLIARADRPKPWTILVYMAADNDLAPYALWDLYEMEAGFKSGRHAAGSTARADLVVQLRMPGEPEARRIHVVEQPSEIYDDHLTLEDFRRRTVQEILSPVVETVPPGQGDLKRFVEWGTSHYPSSHVMLVVWGHGEGWAPAPFVDLRRFGGIAFSDSDAASLDIPTLHQALRAHPVDIYASDACLMQSVEVATELSDSARFVVGSAQIQNYLGLPYRRLMFEINTGRFAGERARPGVVGTPAEHDEPLLLARMLPRLFRMSLEDRGLHGRVLPVSERGSLDLSAVSTQALAQELVPSLLGLSSALSSWLQQDPLRSIELAGLLAGVPAALGDTRELGPFLGALLELTDSGEAPELKAAAKQAISALARTIVSSEEPRALGIWLPSTREDYFARIGDFASSSFFKAQDASWPRWLDALFSFRQ